MSRGRLDRLGCLPLRLPTDRLHEMLKKAVRRQARRRAADAIRAKV